MSMPHGRLLTPDGEDGRLGEGGDGVGGDAAVVPGVLRLEVGDAEEAGVLVDAAHRHRPRGRHARPLAVPLDLQRAVALRHRADHAQPLAARQVAREAERLHEGRNWVGEEGEEE